jgi:tripartite-type tricarboxylate transporter receptor subunit TctC
MRMLALLLAALAAPIAAADNAAQSYPAKPVRLVVGFPPGGATDLVARSMQQRMSAALGQQVVVDNRPGAHALIAGELTALAPPDGYTILLGDFGMLIVVPAIQKVPFDPLKDLAAVGQAVSLQNLILTHPGVQAKTLKELIAMAKAKPESVNYATSGIGSPGHLAAVLLESMAGIRLTHIPYKGGGPAITDLLAGHVPVFFAVISTGVPYVQSGKARGLAVTGTRRAEAIPDVPTIAEAGVPGYAATNWYGLHAPAKTPKAIVDRVNAAMTAALKSPDVIETLKSRGIDAAPSSPAAYAAFMAAENAKWSKIVRQSGIKADDQ